MISVEEAREIITGSTAALEVETCLLEDSLGRILSADVIATRDIPPFDNASMDGFAVRAEDIHSASPQSPVVLSLSGEQPAGTQSAASLGKGQAVRIMTGAPIPLGADAVAEQELTESRNGSVRFLSAAFPGRNIRRRGESMRAGNVVLRKGTRLKPASVGVLASLGITAIQVFRRPRVALITTGNEVVDVKAVPGPGQIWNSNGYTLGGLLRENGAEVIDLGIVGDDKKALAEKMRKALEYDAVVTSGGVSVGKYDLVLDVLKSLGVEIRFWKVNIKPGMPMAFSVFRRKVRDIPIFALPGNPVSVMVTFHQLVRPGLARISGLKDPDAPLILKAVLSSDIPKQDGKRHFVRGIARNERGEIFVTTTGSQSSGVLNSMAEANCLIILPEEARDVRAGDSVEIELL